MDDLEPNYEYSDTGFPVSRPIQYFALAFRSPSVVRLINIDQHIASCVQEKVEQLLPLEKSGYVCFSDYHTGFTGRFNIYDLVLEKPFFKGNHMLITKLFSFLFYFVTFSFIKPLNTIKYK